MFQVDHDRRSAAGRGVARGATHGTGAGSGHPVARPKVRYEYRMMREVLTLTVRLLSSKASNWPFHVRLHEQRHGQSGPCALHTNRGRQHPQHPYRQGSPHTPLFRTKSAHGVRAASPTSAGSPHARTRTRIAPAPPPRPPRPPRGPRLPAGPGDVTALRSHPVVLRSATEGIESRSATSEQLPVVLQRPADLTQARREPPRRLRQGPDGGPGERQVARLHDDREHGRHWSLAYTQLHRLVAGR